MGMASSVNYASRSYILFHFILRIVAGAKITV